MLLLRLSKQWIDKLVLLPESGMGYQKVDVLLKDGRTLKGLVVSNAEYLNLPTEEDIVELKLER